jgi:muramoyltetrapeptide carboxypeptidase
MAVPKNKKLIIPPFLQKGDTIGIATPASPYKQDLLQAGIRQLSQWGFKVILGRNAVPSKGFLAGTDRDRAGELMDLLADPEIKAVLCSRGGYGTIRILDYLDFGRIKAQPKLLMGFSDLTVLLTALWKEADLMTFHGPVVTSLSRLNAASLSRVRAALTGHVQIKIPLDRHRAFSPGGAQGVLLGGNLTLITHLIGTPYEPFWDGVILFLEDCSEEPYRLDRLFMHLKMRGILRRVSAVLLGQFIGSNKKEVPGKIIKKMVEDLDIPIWSGLPIGHGSRNFPLPIGAPASINAQEAELLIHL